LYNFALLIAKYQFSIQFHASLSQKRTTMKMFLLRHGDRSAGYGDVELSSEGQRQAKELASQPALQKIDVILSSPKLRTRQTVQPLADQLGLTVEIEGALDQRKSIETQNEFTQRVLHFMDQAAEKYQD